MNKKEIIQKIMKKKEFSELPLKDVEMAFEKVDKETYSDEEKIKFTRALLLKTFSFSLSKRLLTIKEKEPEWFLRKHISTRDRIQFYPEIYQRIFYKVKKTNVFDFGAGVNGFSYEHFSKANVDVNYIGVEAIGQLVKLVNNYFKNKKINGNVFHLSLFELNKIKKIILDKKGLKIAFLFKTFDSLELLQRNYTKNFLLEITPLVDKFVLSFAIKTMRKKETIWAKRTWLLNFIKENFEVLDEFEIGFEKFIIFRKKKK